MHGRFLFQKHKVKKQVEQDKKDHWIGKEGAIDADDGCIVRLNGFVNGAVNAFCTRQADILSKAKEQKECRGNIKHDFSNQGKKPQQKGACGEKSKVDGCFSG